MSVDYSAKLVYGVKLTETESYEVQHAMKERDGYEDMITPYLQWSNSYFSDEGTSIIGVIVKAVSAGDSIEIGTTIPESHCIDPVLDILDAFHIEREPTWHLICEVS